MKTIEIYEYVISMLTSGDFTLKGDEVWMSCPGCGDDEHFSVNIKKGCFNCWKCIVGGFFLEHIGRDISRWRSLISRIDGEILSGEIRKDISFDREVCSKPSMDIMDIYKTPVYNPDDTGNVFFSVATKAFKYLQNRGVKIQQIISYKPYVHKWEPTVYFPYWNESGEQTFYIGRRFVDDDGPKTLEPKSSTKPLFGLHVKRPKPVVFLVEGVFDHLMTPDSYAILGSMITEQQVSSLRKYNIERIFVLMDPDASDKCLNNAFRLNRSGLRAWPVMFGGDKDPGDLGLAQMSGVCNHLRNLRLSRMQDIYVDCKSFGG